jgi:DNA-binding XRE family transcriptional regulator
MSTNTQQRKRSPLKNPNRRLTELRINEGLSPNELAYRAGVSGQTVRMCEAGFTPTPRIQFALARVFGLSPLDLWPIDRQRTYR